MDQCPRMRRQDLQSSGITRASAMLSGSTCCSWEPKLTSCVCPQTKISPTCRRGQHRRRLAKSVFVSLHARECYQLLEALGMLRVKPILHDAYMEAQTWERLSLRFGCSPGAAADEVVEVD